MLDFLKRIFQRRRLSPVSKALDVEAGVLEEQVLNAIAAVDRIHTDGMLPDLPVKAAPLVDMYGFFRNDGRKGRGDRRQPPEPARRTDDGP